MDVDLPPIPQLPEQVLAMDDLTDSSSEDEMPTLIDDNEEEVDLPPLPAQLNLGPIQIDDVPLADLVPFEDLVPLPNQNPLLGLQTFRLDLFTPTSTILILGSIYTLASLLRPVSWSSPTWILLAFLKISWIRA